MRWVIGYVFIDYAYYVHMLYTHFPPHILKDTIIRPRGRCMVSSVSL